MQLIEFEKVKIESHKQNRILGSSMFLEKGYYLKAITTPKKCKVRFFGPE